MCGGSTAGGSVFADRAVVAVDPSLHLDPVRLADHLEDDRQPDADEHRVLERDHECQHERHGEDRRLDLAGLRHRVEIVGLTVRKPTSMSSPAREGSAIFDTAGPKSRITTAITTAAYTRAWRLVAPADLTSDDPDIDPPTGMPLEEPACDVGGALADEVPGRVRVGAIGVREVGGDAGALHETDEGERDRGDQQRDDEPEVGKDGPGQGAGHLGQVGELRHLVPTQGRPRPPRWPRWPRPCRAGGAVVRSRAMIRAIVASPIASVWPSNRLGWRSVSIARATRFEPVPL